MTILLKPMKHLLSQLRNTGITVSSPCQQLRRIKLQPLFGVFDLIAKAPVLNMVQFNGANGCPICVHPGVWDSTHLYLPGSEYPLRTDASMRRDTTLAQREDQWHQGTISIDWISEPILGSSNQLYALRVRRSHEEVIDYMGRNQSFRLLHW